MRGDGRDKFFRNSKFDDKTKKIMKDFNKLKQEMINDDEKGNDEKR